MIRLACGNCGQVLSVDDAFAGGVCRCRHCGAIQSVPADARADAGDDPADAAEGSAPLYRREEQHEGPSGLDELADVVASSGLSSGLGRRARSRHPRPEPPPVAVAGPAKPDRRLVVAVGVAAVLGLVATGLAVALLAGDGRTPAAPAPAESRPEFLGLPLGRQAIFVVDRGKASAASFAVVNDLVLAAVDRMPPGSTFQIVYWPRPGFDDRPPSVPGRALRSVSDAALRDARREIEDLSTGGATDVLPAVEAAFAERPDTVVIVTGKGYQLGPDFAAGVLAARDASPAGDAVVHAVAVDDASDGRGQPLRTVAEATGGEFRGYDLPALRRALTER